jgi:hypothetical protein
VGKGGEGERKVVRGRGNGRGSKEEVERVGKEVEGKVGGTLREKVRGEVGGSWRRKGG